MTHLLSLRVIPEQSGRGTEFNFPFHNLLRRSNFSVFAGYLAAVPPFHKFTLPIVNQLDSLPVLADFCATLTLVMPLFVSHSQHSSLSLSGAQSMHWSKVTVVEVDVVEYEVNLRLRIIRRKFADQYRTPPIS